MRDRHGGATCRQPPERFGDACLGRRIDRAGRFVEDQQARIGDLRAHERDQLSLADRELFTALTGTGVQPVLERAHPLAESQLERCVDLAIGGALAPGLDVLAHRPVEEEAVLHHTDRDPARRRVDLSQVGAPTSIEPVRGSARRVSSFANVVLPLPVSPTIATCAPAGIATPMSWRTGGPPR